MKKRQRVSRRLVPNPYIPKSILEGDKREEEEESTDKEEQVPL